MVLYKQIFFENDCRHHKYFLRSIFEAILYILVTGCQWRMLPYDYPKWQLVYYYFRKWFKEGRIEHLLRKLVRKVRRKRGQQESPSVGALDAQSVKWSNRKSDNGFDANKKVKGIKRNVVVDRNGFILARTVCSASIHYSHQAHPLCEMASEEWERLEKVLVDREYRGEVAADIEKDFSINLEVSNTPNGTNGFIPKPLRWVVERTFSWLDWFRRLFRNYEESTEVAEEMIDLAAIKILLNQI